METSLTEVELFVFEGAPSGTVVINDRCSLRTEDGHRVVIVCGGAVWPHRVGDRMAEAYAMVGLVEEGWADQVDVARAFGCSTRTVRRYQRRLEVGGLAALGRPRGYPQGRARVTPSRVDELERLKREGMPNREIGRRLAVTEKSVRKLLRRRGWKAPDHRQLALPLASEGADPKLSASAVSEARVADGGLVSGADPKLSGPDSDAVPVSFDVDPSDRSVDRLLAYLGLLDDAAPLFRAGERVPRAGVLLAIPALVQSGVLEVARQVYGSIGPAFYGLRTTLVTLLLMALLRIKRPEGLKEVSPEDLGRVLGLDRAPEVKTLRRKLKRLAALRSARVRFQRLRMAVRGLPGRHGLRRLRLVPAGRRGLLRPGDGRLRRVRLREARVCGQARVLRAGVDPRLCRAVREASLRPRGGVSSVLCPRELPGPAVRSRAVRDVLRTVPVRRLLRRGRVR